MYRYTPSCADQKNTRFGVIAGDYNGIIPTEADCNCTWNESES